jgi:hypothetical protein
MEQYREKLVSNVMVPAAEGLSQMSLALITIPSAE